MKNKILILSSAFSAACFTWLFYRNNPGINIALFTLIVATMSWILNKKQERSWLSFSLMMAVVSLSVLYATHSNAYTLFVYFIVGFFWLGSLSLPAVKWILAMPEETILSFFNGQNQFFKCFNSNSGRDRGGMVWRTLIIGFVFIVIIGIFLGLYSSGNAIFANATNGFGEWFGKLFDHLSILLSITIIFGLLVSNWILQRTMNQVQQQKWAEKHQHITRVKGNLVGVGLRSSLRFEYRTGVALFVILNVLLLLLNFADLWLVWMGFEWQGQLLKDFVHDGTWNLIVSILIASGIILFYFRGNINLMSRNKWLKRLSYVWIAQNMFLAASLFIRNGLYISHYGLAYRRIGIFFFLAAVVLMLLFLIIKINKKESMLFFFNRNMIATMGILTISALPDWSQIITRYNFSNYKKSYVHIEFLANMPDRCLPVMYRYRYKLKDIRVQQSRLGYRYTDSVEGVPFEAYLLERIQNFKTKYPPRKWQEFVWADHRAFIDLSKDPQ